jgi:hypothetical protein
MPDQLDVTFATVESLPAELGQADAPLIVMPFVDAAMAHRAAQLMARRAGIAGQLLCIHDVERIGFVAVANLAFRRSVAPQFGYTAQDAFAGRRWLVLALEKLAENDGGLLAFNDGKWAGMLAAFGLVSRQWALGNYGGDLFFPEYKRHYADTELTLLAMQQRKYRFEPLALLVEADWEKDGLQVDAADRVLYYRRGQGAYDGRVTNAGLRRLFR